MHRAALALALSFSGCGASSAPPDDALGPTPPDAELEPAEPTDAAAEDAGRARGSAGDAAPTHGALRVMALGDSITQGNEGDYTWRYFLWRALGEAGLAVNFVGPRSAPFAGTYAVTGWDCDHDALWGHSVSAELGETRATVQAHRPEVLLVLLGTNDLTWLARAPADVCADMAKVLDDAQRAAPELTLLVAELGGAAPLAPALLRAYNACLADLLARRERAWLVPLAPLFDHTTDTYDGTHPNVRGEQLIAEQFAALLRAHDVAGAR